MQIEGRKVLVLGGAGLVGMAVCRELLARRPRELQVHSLRPAEVEEALAALAPEAGATSLTGSSGDLFGLAGEAPRFARIRAQLDPLTDGALDRYLLYRVLTEGRPDLVVDAINAATGIAYRDVFRAADAVVREVEGVRWACRPPRGSSRRSTCRA
ncbi:MAG: hypothetical protein M5U13_14755 [Thermoanaerobaculia bacterium]|nr:hypothetical protein [Thermoanaerobaculia bacterium]